MACSSRLGHWISRRKSSWRATRPAAVPTPRLAAAKPGSPPRAPAPADASAPGSASPKSCSAGVCARRQTRPLQRPHRSDPARRRTKRCRVEMQRTTSCRKMYRSAGTRSAPPLRSHRASASRAGAASGSARSCALSWPARPTSAAESEHPARVEVSTVTRILSVADALMKKARPGREAGRSRLSRDLTPEKPSSPKARGRAGIHCGSLDMARERDRERKVERERHRGGGWEAQKNRGESEGLTGRRDPARDKEWKYARVVMLQRGCGSVTQHSRSLQASEPGSPRESEKLSGVVGQSGSGGPTLGNQDKGGRYTSSGKGGRVSRWGT